METKEFIDCVDDTINMLVARRISKEQAKTEIITLILPEYKGETNERQRN